MRAFFDPEQGLHDPQQFMRLGKISEPKDLPSRTDALLKALSDHGITPEAPADYGLDPVLAVHTRPFVEFLSTAYERWSQLPDAGAEVLPNASPYWNGRPEWTARPPCRSGSVVAQTAYYLGDLAVPVGPATWRSALRSAHTAVAGADAVIDGGGPAFALCRPSGHHARADRASGFCYLSNAAIATERLRSRYKRVAVLDVDAHHGDGTQEVFYRRGDVLTVSVHVDPEHYYPFFTGYADETGVDEGTGCNLNLPIPPGSDNTAFLAAVARGIDRIRDFGAEALVVSLGYDAHEEDPIGLLKVTDTGFHAVGEQLRAVGLPTLVVQEGGYQVSVIGACLSAFLHGLKGTEQ